MASITGAGTMRNSNSGAGPLMRLEDARTRYVPSPPGWREALATPSMLVVDDGVSVPLPVTKLQSTVTPLTGAFEEASTATT